MHGPPLILESGKDQGLSLLVGVELFHLSSSARCAQFQGAKCT